MFFFLGHYQNKELIRFMKNILGIKPRNILLYKTALIHRSSTHKDKKGNKINNERLEYLGDTVLSTIIGDYLFKKYPYQGEGFLTEMRSKIVSRASLNALAKRIGLSSLIECNKSSAIQFLSMDGDAFEAFVGALYLDKGYEKTYKVLINHVFTIYIDIESMESLQWNYKSKLIDWVQKNKYTISFKVIDIDETSYRKQYKVQVVINNEPQDDAIDFSIKSAEQLASEKTYKRLVNEKIIIPQKQLSK